MGMYPFKKEFADWSGKLSEHVYIFCCYLTFQDARKGVLFIDFPPVLQLQLKRFEYDFVRDTMVKVNKPD